MVVVFGSVGWGNAAGSVDTAASTGEGGSCSSSESESDDSLPELSGESGLSGASASGCPVAAGTGAMLATASCRRTHLGKILTGAGRRS